MDLVSWSATLVGAILLLVTLWAVLLAVLHIDDTGFLGAQAQAGIWRASVAGARRRPRLRRPLLALAGPMMVVATFAVWVALFILGFALIFWPHLHHFRADDELVVLTFVDALYFSGITGTVLGYGDLTPLTPGLRILAFVESGVGFALLTGIVTYLINIVSGVAARNALAVRLDGESGGTGDGTELVVRCLRYESVGDFRSRLQSLLSEAHDVQEKMRQFPTLDLYQRSRSATRDPEQMLATYVDAALACRIVAQQEGMQRLRPTAEEMHDSAERLMALVANRHMRRSVREALRQATIGQDDRARVEGIREYSRSACAATRSRSKRRKPRWSCGSRPAPASSSTSSSASPAGVGSAPARDARHHDLGPLRRSTGRAFVLGSISPLMGR